MLTRSAGVICLVTKFFALSTARSLSSLSRELRSRKRTINRRSRRASCEGAFRLVNRSVLAAAASACAGPPGGGVWTYWSTSSMSKLWTCWVLPSSSTVKSLCLSPRTSAPFLSRTVTLTSTSSLVTLKVKPSSPARDVCASSACGAIIEQHTSTASNWRTNWFPHSLIASPKTCNARTISSCAWMPRWSPVQRSASSPWYRSPNSSHG